MFDKCNDNYIKIGIDIIRNIKCCNIILITIHLFGDNILKDNEMKAL